MKRMKRDLEEKVTAEKFAECINSALGKNKELIKVLIACFGDSKCQSKK